MLLAVVSVWEKAGRLITATQRRNTIFILGSFGVLLFFSNGSYIKKIKAGQGNK